jgi:hypothetical protein
MSRRPSCLAITTMVFTCLLLPAVREASAQTTAFSYHGRLTENGSPAAGDFDLQFKLFDTPNVGSGTQAGNTLVRTPITVSDGVFTVQLDFGANVFDGSPRFLEIGVRPAGSPSAYVVLLERQPITSTPYAIQTINAERLGGVPASEYVRQGASGNVAIGATEASHRLRIAGGPPWTTAFWGGALELDNASAIGWQANSSGNKFGIGHTNTGLHLFSTSSDPGTTGAAAVSRLQIDNNGNVGIGMAATSKLEIAAQDGLAITGFQPYLTLRDANAGGLRTVLQGAEGSFVFYPDSTIGSFPAMVLRNNGRLGLGTTTPRHRLSIANSPSWTTANWGGAIELQNASAIGWAANSAGNRFGIGQTNGGLFFFATGSDPGTTGSPAPVSMAIDDSGNVGIGTTTPRADLDVVGNAVQSRVGSGFAKALAVIEAGTIHRCYNGLTNSSAGSCGFGIAYNNATRTTTINFGFFVDDRFIVLTPISPGGIEREIWRPLYITHLFADRVDVHSELIECDGGSGFCDVSAMRFVIAVS